MNYLTIKYEYIYFCDHPLLAMMVVELDNPTSKDSMAYTFVMDYYSDGDYLTIFEPSHI
jgi:hypothetical protein